MGFETIASIAAPVVGSLLGGSGSKSSSSTAPWKAQQPYLKEGYNYAQDAYNTAAGMGYYTDPRVAAMNPYQTAGLNMTGDFATGMAPNIANTQIGMGMDSLGYGTQYGANASSLLNNYVNGDPSQYALGMANTFSSNPYVNDLITASTRDISRNLYENQLPNLINGAAGTGNLNSTRTGYDSIASGILQRGAADRMSDVAANIRSSLFSQGLNQGLNQYNTTFTNALQGNNQLLNTANWAGNMLNSGINTMYNASDAAARAGQAYTNYDQSVMDADRALFNEQKYGGLDLVSKYMGAIGSPTGTTSTTSAPGGATGALGGATAGLGLYNTLKSTFSAPVAPTATQQIGAYNPNSGTAADYANWANNNYNGYTGN